MVVLIPTAGRSLKGRSCVESSVQGRAAEGGRPGEEGRPGEAGRAEEAGLCIGAADETSAIEGWSRRTAFLPKAICFSTVPLSPLPSGSGCSGAGRGGGGVAARAFGRRPPGERPNAVARER